MDCKARWGGGEARGRAGSGRHDDEQLGSGHWGIASESVGMGGADRRARRTEGAGGGGGGEGGEREGGGRSGVGRGGAMEGRG